MGAYIIGEIGSNFDGKFDQAIRLIDIAANSGVDAVKFQLFKASVLYPDGPVSSFESVRAAELPRDWVSDLKLHAESCGLDFLASPFDLDAVNLLERLGVVAYKIASSEIQNKKLLIAIAKTKRPIYLSTGMSSMADVAEAVEVLDSNNSGSVTLLHCTSIYPTPYDEVSLNLMHVLQVGFGKKVGFSDHSLGIAIPLAAVALGATVIEKHFTLDRSLSGPDHSYAIEPDELQMMVRSIRQIESSLVGPTSKIVMPDEKRWGRLEGIYAGKDLCAGNNVTCADIEIKRPGISIPARYKDLLIDLKYTKDLKKGEPINWDDVGTGL
jgi:sialic acid synthase SpsE